MSVDPENGIGFGIAENDVQCYYATSILHNFVQRSAQPARAKPNPRPAAGCSGRGNPRSLGESDQKKLPDPSPKIPRNHNCGK